MTLVEFETTCATPTTPCSAADRLEPAMFSLTNLRMAENMAIIF
jgi:hypothetical protein